MGQSSQDSAIVSLKTTCTADTKSSMCTHGSLSQRRTDPSSHKNYKNVSILVTLPVAMTMYCVRHYLQKEGFSLAHSLGIWSHHGEEGMAAGAEGS